jgi:hypothetical protein
MDRRHNPRVSVQLPAKVWGLDAFGRPFTDSAIVVNMSGGGIVLRGVTRRIRIGELLDVSIGGTKAQFRVIWVGARDHELGLQNLDTQSFLPSSVLSHCAQAAAAC